MALFFVVVGAVIFLPDTILGNFLPMDMTREIALVMLVMIFAIALFILEWVRVDVVGIMMMVLLPLLGLVTPKEAISWLSSNAVVSIIAVIIIGHGLDKTGVMNIFARNIIKLAGKTENRIIALISVTVAFISGFMQNIGAAALFLPVTNRISRQLKIPISRILMPMGYCAIIGWCLTLVGSSPLILLNDLMATWWENNPDAVNGIAFEPFGLFAVTPIWLALIFSALVYFMAFGRFVLPSKKECNNTNNISCFISNKLHSSYKAKVGEVFELSIPNNFEETKLEKLELINKYQCTIVSIFRNKKFISTPLWSEKLKWGDKIALVGTKNSITEVTKDLAWKLSPELKVFAERLSVSNYGVLEAVVTPNSSMVGQTINRVEFKTQYGVTPLALFRDGDVSVEYIYNTEIKAWDAFLLYWPWESFHKLKEATNLAFIQEIKWETQYPKMAKYAVGWLVIALALALWFDIQLSIALLTWAIGMVLTKVMTIDEAYKSVDWMTIFLLAWLIPLWAAFEQSGAAKFIADTIISNIGTVSPITLLAVIGLLTTFFTLVASNVGATVLLVPLAMNMAVQMNVNPVMAALVVGIAASNTFVLPTHQVNALIMNPGGYKTVDYIKSWAGMTVIYMIVMILMLNYFYI